VTGGGRGIGAAAAEALAVAGARVAVAARNMEQVVETAARLRDLGHEVVAFRCDVTLPMEVRFLAYRSLSRRPKAVLVRVSFGDWDSGYFFVDFIDVNSLLGTYWYDWRRFCDGGRIWPDFPDNIRVTLQEVRHVLKFIGVIRIIYAFYPGA